MALHFLFFELLVAPGLEGPESLIKSARRAPIDPDGRAREIGEQPFVVAYQGERGAAVLERLFEPFDGDDVEMVGRLVEQQDVRLGREHARERRAARLAAGKLGRIGLGDDTELFHEGARAIGVVGVVETRQNEVERRGKTGEIGLLRQIAHARAGLHETLSVLGLKLTRGDAKQCRLSRPVAAHQRDAVAGRNAQFRAIEQRRAAQRDVDVSKLQKRRHMVQTLAETNGRKA